MQCNCLLLGIRSHCKKNVPNVLFCLIKQLSVFNFFFFLTFCGLIWKRKAVVRIMLICWSSLSITCAGHVQWDPAPWSKKKHSQKLWYLKVADPSSLPPWHCENSGSILLFCFCCCFTLFVSLCDFSFKWSSWARLVENVDFTAQHIMQYTSKMFPLHAPYLASPSAAYSWCWHQFSLFRFTADLWFSWP